jgi:tetratricopeptide (TPR) repeat protein
LEKAVQFEEQWTRTYPRSPGAWLGLGIVYDQLGRHELSLAAWLETIRLNPASFPYGYAAYEYQLLNRFVEARATLQEARAKHIDAYQAFGSLYVLDFLQNDAAGMAEQLTHAWTDVPAGVKENIQGATAAYSGRLAQAREWTRRAVVTAMSAQVRGVAARFKAESALREALFGNLRAARDEAKEARGLSTDSDVQGRAALALALSGDWAEAQRLAHDLNEQYPEATVVRFVHLPVIQAAVALWQGETQKASESLAITARYEFAGPPFGFPMMPVYVHGEAQLAAQQGMEAAAEFQKIIDHRGVVGNSAVGALAYLGLGRAYALTGDTIKARSAYQDFLTLWKDADADIPVFKQAKAEYAKLQ